MPLSLLLPSVFVDVSRRFTLEQEADPMYRILVCAFTVLLLTPLRVAAQEIAITGQVVDAGTVQPLASVQVFIPALDIGGLTGPNGRYLLTNVPAGTHEIRFGRIGYRTVSREVTIRTGATLELNVSLGEQAIALDEIIVTGTAGGVEKRALGNAVSTINSSRLAERIATPPDISRLINGRAPGVFFQPFSGSMGMGGRVRLRGGASFSLPLEPLIYIDGVRVDNRAKTGPTTVRDPGSPGIYPSISRLNDLNPEDIDRVEIIKGPAASTLYGTEAANGVIQIFTKRGRPGPARWSASASVGPNWISSPETPLEADVSGTGRWVGLQLQSRRNRKRTGHTDLSHGAVAALLARCERRLRGGPVLPVY